MTIVEFLRTRYDEEALTASGASSGPWRPWRGRPGIGFGDLAHGVVVGDQAGVSGEVARIATTSWLDAEHIARHDPARVLADVEAKRRIVDLHEGSHECSVYERRVDWDGQASVEIDSFTFCLNSEDCSTLRLLALPYADHPDYDPAWRLAE